MKMLCIDGGGIRGVFAIAILEELEKDHGRSIRNLIDAVAGTSTGSIIAASIAVEKEMTAVLDGYRKFGEKIFERKARIGLFRSIYSDRFLRRFIQEAFHDRTLAEVEIPLLIPAVDVTNGKPYVHRSNCGNQVNSEDAEVLLWDAVLSSCSAPIYFPPNDMNNQRLAIDGGLWANNPSLVCLTEAIQHFKKRMTEIQILSIGLGQQKIHFTHVKPHLWGIKNWLPFHFPTMSFTPKLLDLALHLSSESISYQCQNLLGENYLRLNCELEKEVPFDSVDNTEWLIQLGKKVYREQREEINRFLIRN